MSKWFDEKKFGAFAKKIKEAEWAEQQSRSFGAMFPKYSKPFDVTYILRFLPAMKDSNPTDFYQKEYYHSFPGQDGKWLWVTCPWTYGDKKCPLCRIVSKLYASPEREDRRMANALKRKQRWLSNVYVVDDPRDPKVDKERRTGGKVKILGFSFQVERKVRAASDTNSATGIGSKIIDPENGFDFYLKVVEKKTDGATYPNYEESEFARQSTSLAKSEKEIDAILKQVHFIGEFIENDRTPVEKILEILEEEMLIDYLDPLEREQLASDADEETGGIGTGLGTELPKSDEEDIPDSVTDPKAVEPKVEAKEPEAEEEEEEDSFLRELDSIDFNS